MAHYFDIKKIVNLTYQTVVIINDNNEEIIRFEPSGRIFYAKKRTLEMPAILFDNVSIPLISKEFLYIRGLPEPSPGILFIVDPSVAEALPGRGDLVVPDKLIEDEKGNILGYRCLALI